MPDAPEWGDPVRTRSATSANRARCVCLIWRASVWAIFAPLKGVEKIAKPRGAYGNAHWLQTVKTPPPVTGRWPASFWSALSQLTQRLSQISHRSVRRADKSAGDSRNIAASGTEIIKDLGAEHVRTGKPIVYTSADSVFQIAAHEEVIPLERQYQICETATRPPAWRARSWPRDRASFSRCTWSVLSN